VMGSVKSSCPPGFSKRRHSAMTRGRSGKWLIASIQVIASKLSSENGNCAVASTDLNSARWARPRCAAGRSQLQSPVRVDPHHRTSRGSRDPQRWTSGSTTHIEQGLRWGEVEPIQEPVLLLRCVPTVLSNVLAKCFPTDLSVYFRLKISVVGVVVTGRRQRSGFAHRGTPSKTGLDASCS